MGGMILVVLNHQYHVLNVHLWFNVTSIIPHSPDDGSLEPKLSSIDFVSQ